MTLSEMNPGPKLFEPIENDNKNRQILSSSYF
jgi:hypothetical protein